MDIFLNFDYSILDFIANNIRNEFLDPIMAAVSLFAEKGLGWVILGLILLIPKKTRPAAVTALAAMTFALLFGEFAIKSIVARPRPFVTYESFHSAAMPFTLNTGEASGFSFPSGHTGASFAFAASMYKVNKRVGVIATVAAAIVGFSRLYNYVHFPTDVIAGMIFGIVAALIFIFIFNKFGVDDKLRRIGRKKV